MQWPEPESSDPYDLNLIHPPARPRTSSQARPVDAVPPGAVLRSRPCNGPAADLPDGEVIYWCSSCNRRVEHYNQPLCLRHAWQRSTWVRDVAREEKKQVRVDRDALRQARTATDRLVGCRVALDAAPREQQLARLNELRSAIDAYQNAMYRLPSGKVVVRPRPIADYPGDK